MPLVALVWQSDRSREYFDDCALTKPFFSQWGPSTHTLGDRRSVLELLYHEATINTLTKCYTDEVRLERQSAESAPPHHRRTGFVASKHYAK